MTDWELVWRRLNEAAERIAERKKPKAPTPGSLRDLRQTLPGFALYPHERDAIRQRLIDRHVIAKEQEHGPERERRAIARACVDDLDRERFGV